MKLKKSDIKYLVLLVGIVLLFFLFIRNISKIIIFTVLTLISGGIVFLNYLIRFPVDFSPVFFLSLVITSTLGFGYTILFVILSGFLPAVFLGGFKPNVFVYLFVNLLLNLISIPFSFNLLVEGVVLSFLYFLLVSLINGAMESRILPDLLMGLASFGINVVYFWKLSEILISVLK